MRESRRSGALRAARAMCFVLLGVLVGSIGSRMVRAGGPEAACAGAPLFAPEESVRELPPEWRWTPPKLSLERMYGTQRRP